jgi:hypothetical protein
LVVALVGGLLGGAVAGGWWWRSTQGGSEAAKPSSAGGVPATAVPPVAAVTAPVSVLAHRRDDGRLDFVVMAGTNRAGDRSALVLIPTTTQLEVPANGIQQVAELDRLGGEALLTLGMENALGVAVADSAVLDSGAWRSMLETGGQLLVTLPAPVSIESPAASFAAGPQSLSPEQAVTLLTNRATGATELDHLATVRAVLDAWLEAVQSGDRAASVTQAVAEAAPLATAARTGATIDVLPVDSIGVGADERYVIATSDAQSLVSKSFPDALFTQSARPRIEIRGSGDPEILAASSCIVEAGGSIRLTGRGESADNTSVVFYRDRQRATAERMQTALGVGTVKQADRDLDIVDVTIVVGKDFTGCQ